MPLSPSKSEQYAKYDAQPRQYVPSSDWGSKLRYSFGKITFTAAGQGTAQMVRLPAGRVRVLSDLSRIICPAGTTTSDLHVGYGPYTKQDGTAVARVDNAFANDLDVGGGAIDQPFPLPAEGFIEFDSRDGVDIEIMIDTANGPASGNAYVMVAFMQGN
jgi:hypothetical protein